MLKNAPMNKNMGERGGPRGKSAIIRAQAGAGGRGRGKGDPDGGEFRGGICGGFGSRC